MHLPRVLIPLADGVEEMEAVILIDVLRRAGWSVVTAGIRAGPVTASRGVVLVPDALWCGIDPAGFDLLALPGGGPGTEALMADGRVVAAVRAFLESGRPVAAICAAARVLDRAGVLGGKSYTCYPGVEARIGSGTRLDFPVVRDGLVHTSQGPGTAIVFALHLVAALESPGKAEALGRELVLGGAVTPR